MSHPDKPLVFESGVWGPDTELVQGVRELVDKLDQRAMQQASIQPSRRQQPRDDEEDEDTWPGQRISALPPSAP